MTNNDQNQHAVPAQRSGSANTIRAGRPSARSENEKTEMVKAEIMKTWNKLSDEDVRLYDRQPNLFFERVREKQGVSMEVAQRRLDEITLSCERSSNNAAA